LEAIAMSRPKYTRLISILLTQIGLAACAGSDPAEIERLQAEDGIAPPSAMYSECAYGYRPSFPPSTTRILSVSP